MNTFDKSCYGLVTVSLRSRCGLVRHIVPEKMKQMVSGTPDEPRRRTKVSRNMLSRFLDTTITRTRKHNNKLYRNQQCARCCGCLAPVRKELQNPCSMLVRTQFIFWVQHSRFNRKHWMTFATNRKPWLEMLLGLTVIGSNQHIVSVRQGIINSCLHSLRVMTSWLHQKGERKYRWTRTTIIHIWEIVRVCHVFLPSSRLWSHEYLAGMVRRPGYSKQIIFWIQHNHAIKWNMILPKKHVTSVRDHSWASTFVL